MLNWKPYRGRQEYADSPHGRYRVYPSKTRKYWVVKFNGANQPMRHPTKEAAKLWAEAAANQEGKP